MDKLWADQSIQGTCLAASTRTSTMPFGTCTHSHFQQTHECMPPYSEQAQAESLLTGCAFIEEQQAARQAETQPSKAH